MVVRGCVHGGVVICEVRVAASPVVHDRADRAVPCAPLLGGVGDAARTRCAARQRARSCRPCGRNRWSGAPLPGVPVGKPPDWIPVGGPDRAASLVRAAPGTPRSASTSLNPRARLLEVRARGLSDELAGRGTCSRVTRRSRGPGLERCQPGWDGNRSRAHDGPRSVRPTSHWRGPGWRRPDPGRSGPAQTRARVSACWARLAQCELSSPKSTSARTM